jgi:hypothetical protein
MEFNVSKMREFVIHNYVGLWQKKQYTWFILNIEKGEAMSLINKLLKIIGSKVRMKCKNNIGTIFN